MQKFNLTSQILLLAQSWKNLKVSLTNVFFFSSTVNILFLEFMIKADLC